MVSRRLLGRFLDNLSRNSHFTSCWNLSLMGFTGSFLVMKPLMKLDRKKTKGFISSDNDY